MEETDWDVFISHASEDKESFVRPLAEALQRLGLKVWYDEFSLKLGDSLSQSIDKGLTGSRYGIVVLSPQFIRKDWPQRELRGLVTLEMTHDKTFIPIWYGITKSQVVAFSPSLGDKVAIRTENQEASDVALAILRTVRPDLYLEHEPVALRELASGKAVRILQEQIDRSREELAEVSEQLSEYQCPRCRAPLSLRAAEDGRYEDIEHESFECGYSTIGYAMAHPCPSDPRYPSMDDYEVSFRDVSNEGSQMWQCSAEPKTDMARMVCVLTGYGATQDEAELQLRENFTRFNQRRSA